MDASSVFTLNLPIHATPRYKLALIALNLECWPIDSTPLVRAARKQRSGGDHTTLALGTPSKQN